MIIHAYNYVGILYTIEVGLYIPMMSLLKRALGLHEQASWMHPTISIGELSYTHSSLCIYCMAIPTSHIISITFGFPSTMIVLIDVSLSHFLTFFPYY